MSDELVTKLEALRNEVKRLNVQERGNNLVRLTTPLTSTAWDGDSFSTTAKTLIDLSAVFSVPAGVSAICVNITAKDSGSAGSTSCYAGLSPNNTAGQLAIMARPAGKANDAWEDEYGVCPCDSNGDVYYQISATGASTMDVYIVIWGYWK